MAGTVFNAIHKPANMWRHPQTGQAMLIYPSPRMQFVYEGLLMAVLSILLSSSVFAILVSLIELQWPEVLELGLQQWDMFQLSRTPGSRGSFSSFSWVHLPCWLRSLEEYSKANMVTIPTEVNKEDEENWQWSIATETSSSLVIHCITCKEDLL